MMRRPWLRWCAGMVFARVSRRVRRAVPPSAGPGRGGFSFLTGAVLARGYEKPGANAVTLGFPVTVCLVAEVRVNFGRAFCARCERRCRRKTRSPG
jgi:hypothetical protein